jgi:putative CocE/NonD family hydrolase
MSQVKILVNVPVPARDGVILNADIYMPDKDGKYPAALIRSPYDATKQRSEEAIASASEDIVTVIMDCRGSRGSGGDFHAWLNESNDGEDTIKWIVSMPWSNGRVAMKGGSYLATTQWMAAWRGHESLKAIAPHVSPGDIYDSPNYPGGAFGLGVSVCWGLSRIRKEKYPGLVFDWPKLLSHLPVRDIAREAGVDLKHWDEWHDHPSYDAYWESINLNRYYENVKCPAFITGGWFDLYSKHSLESFTGMRGRGGSAEARLFTRCVIGPWAHGGFAGELAFGCEGPDSLEPERRRFLAGLLRDPSSDPLPDAPPLRYFMMGENKWREAETWPPPELVYKDCFLRGGGSANTLNGDGRLSFERPPENEPRDHFVYNPLNPVPTAGGGSLGCAELLPQGPRDQSKVETRDDVLVYSSEPLEEDLTVAGPVRVTLFASSSAPDTDFTAKLADVHPDGRAFCLCDGIIRARYRDSIREPKPLVPGEVYEFNIDCLVTANIFLKGHRIRLEISSSNFPRFDRNMNTGTPVASESRAAVAMQTVFHDAARPSRIVLPVLAP